MRLLGLFAALLLHAPAWGGIFADPLPPTNLRQYQWDGTTALPPGGVVTESNVVLRATVNTVDAQGQLCVEVKPLTQAFTGVADRISPLTTAGQTASVSISGLATGSYKWRAWVLCTCGLNGPKVEFAGDPDFIMPLSPNSPAPLAQVASDHLTPIPTGGEIFDGVVILKASVSDPAFDSVKLQVELQEEGTPFSNLMTHESIYGVSGWQASIQVTDLSGSYHWQARTVNSAGVASPWVAHGGAPDFVAGSPSASAPGEARHDSRCSGAAGGLTDLPMLVAGFAALSLLAAIIIPRGGRRE